MFSNDPSSTAAHEHNRRAWDARVRAGQAFTAPAQDKEFADPLRVVDGPGWLGGDIRGRNVLCLAAGGGRQAPLYAAAGAVCSCGPSRRRWTSCPCLDRAHSTS